MSKPNKLIAVIATALMVGGERKVFLPGQELPDMNEHDARELEARGAIKSQATESAKDKAAAQQQAQNNAELEAARQKVQAAQASTTNTIADDPAEAGVADTATSKAKK